MFQEHRQAIAYAERATSLAFDLGLPEQARALGFLGGSRILLGEAGGVQDMRRAMGTAVAQGLGREVALLYANLGGLLMPIEGPRAVLETLREGLAFAERRAIEEMVLALRAQIVDVLVDFGSHEEAEVLAGDLAPCLEDVEDVWVLMSLRSSQARLLGRPGKHAEAAPLAEWALERSRDFDSAEFLAAVLPAAAAIRDA